MPLHKPGAGIKTSELEFPNSGNGPPAHKTRRNLPDHPIQIAILESGLNLRNESHGIIRGFRLF
jgi:hypothetical protein